MNLNSPLGFKHASFLYTGSGIRKKDGRKVTESDLGAIPDGAIVYEPAGKILWVGSSQEVPKEYASILWTNLQGKSAVTPGFVDCHTHLIFSGDRSQEFARRCAGTTYEEIAREGGGILTTVKATRSASFDELYELGESRVKTSIGFGVRALEIKSGYGLTLEAELKILKVIHKLKVNFPEIQISSTFMGAHDFPRDVSREKYLEMLLKEALPEVARLKLADACDVFVDEGFYTLAECRTILEKANDFGMKTKVHADELFNTESASLAAELGCLSADHLLKISEGGIQSLARSSTVAVILPGTAFYLKTTQAPARSLIDAGAKVALSTDFNPGTCLSLNLPLMMTISALYQGLSKAEIFAAVTYNAASALGLEKEMGTLEVGLNARLNVLPTRTFEELYYRFG